MGAAAVAFFKKRNESPSEAAADASSDYTEMVPPELDTESETSKSMVQAAEDAATQEVREHWDHELEYKQQSKICKLSSWKLCQIVGRRSAQGRCKQAAKGRSKYGTHHDALRYKGRREKDYPHPTTI